MKRLPTKNVRKDIKHLEDSKNGETVSLKLTDECREAMEAAMESNLPIRYSSRGDEIAIFIGTKTDGILRFSLTPQHVDGSAAVAIDGISQKCRVTEVKKKFQVQATDRSFQDVRRKSVRLAEAVKQTKSNNSEELQSRGREAKPSKLPRSRREGFREAEDA
ncbi:hypothetical protein L596_021557 [Steinernema carpocapsae]|uniref:Uncharacterized protein n=1 Tax=Steinernema carpocapsae TaxID=34508 RepID=A0A4U5MJ38_STECR|nr:hypothetical protein L596_021557 [Steinernema carpocapsae]